MDFKSILSVIGKTKCLWDSFMTIKSTFEECLLIGTNAMSTLTSSLEDEKFTEQLEAAVNLIHEINGRLVKVDMALVPINKHSSNVDLIVIKLSYKHYVLTITLKINLKSMNCILT